MNGIEHKTSCKISVEEGASAPMFTTGAEKFTLGSRIRLRGTGYSSPGLFSGSLEMRSRFNMFLIDDDDFIMMFYLGFISRTYFYGYVCSARFGVIVCNSAPFCNNLSCTI